METLNFRRAKTEDKAAVLAINEHIYKGRDCLSDYYDEFMVCPHTTPFVAVLNENIVGFVATFIVDNGLTVITRAGRVKAKVTGKGIYKQLKEYALHKCDQKVHAQTCSTDNPVTQRESFKANHKLILSRLMFETKPCSTDDLNLPHTNLDLKAVSDIDLKSYFTTTSLKKYLFPKDRLLVNWVPFRLLSENIPLIRLNRSRAQMYSDVTQASHDHTKGLLSVCVTYPCLKQPHTSVLDIYGTDTTTLGQHVVAHIEYIKEFTKDTFMDFIIFVEPEFDTGKLTEVLRKLGLKFSEPRQQQLLYEQDLVNEKMTTVAKPILTLVNTYV